MRYLLLSWLAVRTALVFRVISDFRCGASKVFSPMLFYAELTGS